MSILIKCRLMMVIGAILVFMTGMSLIVPALAEEDSTKPVSRHAVVAAPDEVLWDWLKDSGDRSQLERFIRLYPNSPRAADARARLEILTKPSSASVVVASRSARECSSFWCWWGFSSILHGVGY
jgi:hypothetical protein